MKYKKPLSINEKIEKLQRKNRIILASEICIYFLYVVVIVLVWIFVGWALAVYFSMGVPISLFQWIVMITHNKQEIEKLKNIQKESQLSACEDLHENERKING